MTGCLAVMCTTLSLSGLSLRPALVRMLSSALGQSEAHDHSNYPGQISRNIALQYGQAIRSE